MKKNIIYKRCQKICVVRNAVADTFDPCVFQLFPKHNIEKNVTS